MSLLIIPVIDLLDGLVVHARGGRRAEYAPVQSPLCPSAEPEKVVAALLALHPFCEIYIADLGALLGRDRHDATVARLQAGFPRITFWLDCGGKEPGSNGPGLRPIKIGRASCRERVYVLV